MTARRPLLLVVPLVASLAVAGCGEDSCNALFGSAGQGLDLEVSSVKVQWYSVSETLRVAFTNSRGEQPAIFSADLRDLSPRAGLSVDLSEQVGAEGHRSPRGNLERATNDGQDFARMTGGTLKLDEWGGAGGKIAGSFHAVLEDGKSLNGDFCGTIRAVEL